MSKRKATQARQTNSTEWAQLAFGQGSKPSGGGGGRFGGRGRGAAAIPPREPGLTPTFNDAASDIVTKRKIELLRRKQSQNRHTLEFDPLGSVNKALDRTKDRIVQREISSLTRQMSKQKGLKKKFAQAQEKGKATVQFNRASQSMGM